MTCYQSINQSINQSVFISGSVPIEQAVKKKKGKNLKHKT